MGFYRYLLVILIISVTSLGSARATIYLHELSLEFDHTLKLPVDRPSYDRARYGLYMMSDLNVVDKEVRENLIEDLKTVHQDEDGEFHILAIKNVDVSINKTHRDAGGRPTRLDSRMDYRIYYIAETTDNRLDPSRYRYLRTLPISAVKAEIRLTEHRIQKSFFVDLDDKAAEQWIDQGEFDLHSLAERSPQLMALRAEIKAWLVGRQLNLTTVEGFLHLESMSREKVVPFSAYTLFKDLRLEGYVKHWENLKLACRKFLR